MRQVCIHQPDFVPFMGFFQRLVDSDVFIILDDAQYRRSGWMQRDKIKTPRGSTWLTASINKNNYLVPINEVELGLDTNQWVESNLNLLRENYRQAPYFEQYFPAVEEIYRSGETHFSPFSLKFIKLFLELFQIDVELSISSEMNIPGKSSLRLVELTKSVNGDKYVTGTGSNDYLDHSPFDAAGIGVEIRPFETASYPQLHGSFIANLSSIDVMFNCGPGAADVLRRCNA